MEFTNQQTEVIAALADGILPSTDNSPAASELPVPEMFIQIAKTWNPSVLAATANALDIIHDIAMTVFGVPASAISRDNRIMLVKIVSDNDDLKPFWEPFRLLVAMNYYALPPAYSAIGMPGPTIDEGGLTPEGHLA
ncbi:gluconate 2-dehydrogenase subunit 3 family protein [Marinimicrobium agarilyticum]|uniref:gluconate 2-dehydrogenase subunit 3 family protein n=1 Tax=Marinimicrobium agarilyticum TaxID=306546 RepID=UPI000485DEE3|nr:gluconate 2-dehydrogenase subunit 3 family protein [Marinimicrobium agarilyticum]